MTTARKYADSEGEFEPYQANDEPCPKCGGPTEWTRWHSSDGGYVDVRVVCKARCGWDRWYDGIDS